MAKKLTAVEKNKIKYDEFIKSLDGKTKEELLAIEQDLIKKIDNHDRKVAKTQFNVNDKESLAQAVEIFRYFLNKQEVDSKIAGKAMELANEHEEDIADVFVEVLGKANRLLATRARKAKKIE